MGNDLSIFQGDDSDESSDYYSSNDDSTEEEDKEEELVERRTRRPVYSYKIVIVGRPESGKTALVNRYVRGTYTEAFQSENRDVRTKEIVINEEVTVKLRIWDILPRVAYLPWFEGAAGAIVVYDCTTPSELDALKWKQELDSLSNDRPIPIALVATKCDEKHKKDPRLDQFVKDYGFIGRYDTSAKLDQNITKVFNDLIQHLLANDPTVAESDKPDIVTPTAIKAPPSPLTVPVPHTNDISPQSSPPSHSLPSSHSLSSSHSTSTSPSSVSPPSSLSVVNNVPSPVVQRLERKAEDMYVL